MLAAAKPLSRQKYACRDKRHVCRDKSKLVVTKICLSPQMFYRDKNVCRDRQAYFCRDTRCVLSRQKMALVAAPTSDT